MDDEIRPKALMIPFDKFVILDILPPEQYKNTVTQMRKYVELGQEPDKLELLEQMAFEALRPFMDENIKKYQRKIEVQHRNGSKGGRPKKPKEPSETYGFSEKPNETHGTPKYKVQSSKDTDSKESIEIGTSVPTSLTKSTRFHPPDMDELKAYFAEKGGTDSQAERFRDFYESNGWKVGKNPMKSWKAAASCWIARDKERSKPTNAPRNKAFMASRPPEEAEKARNFLANSQERRRKMTKRKEQK